MRPTGKNILFYLIAFILVICSFLFFSRAYRQIQDYTSLVERRNTVYHYFQELSKQINNAAVINPELLTANNNYSRGMKLFFTDSQTVVRQLQSLRSVVIDSVNISIVNQLDQKVKAELPWLIRSNVPDSIMHHNSAGHVAALQAIDSLIDEGINRTNFLIGYSKNQLNSALNKERVYIVLFIILAGALLVYTTLTLFKQKDKTRTKENELEAANQLLKNAQRIGHIGNWKIDTETEETYWSDEIYNIWNITKTPYPFNYAAFIKSVHPEERELVAAKLAASFNGYKELDIEHRIVLKNGTIKWIHQKGALVIQGVNKTGSFEGTAQDITARKNIELQLLQATAQQYLFVSIVNSSDDAIISKTLDGIITTWNSGAQKTFGYTAEEMIGQHISKIIPAHLISEETDIVSKIKSGKNVEHYKTERIKKDGTHINVSLSVAPVLDASGKITGASKIARDITEQQKAEKEIEIAYTERTTILESIDDAFFAVDKNWIVTYWNSRAEKQLAKTKAQMIGHNLWGVFSDSIGSVSYKKYHEAVETDKAIHFEDHYPPLNSWYEISAYPSASGLSVYFKDVTERKLTEIHLNELNNNLKMQAKELARSNAELEQFAYVASHDLQEPLRMVSSFLTQLEKKYEHILDEKGKKYIGFAVDGSKRMRQIILDLLEFSRVGKTEDKKEILDVDKLVKEILILFRKKVEDKNAVILTEALPVMNTYKIPLYQVFQNLISNALKYAAADRAPEIKITAEELGTHWQFAVADNGIGIEEEYFDKIFVIFQRLHNKDEYAGTGMGLAITKKIVESLGGKIWVTSTEGRGSIFYFTIEK